MERLKTIRYVLIARSFFCVRSLNLLNLFPLVHKNTHSTNQTICFIEKNHFDSGT